MKDFIPLTYIYQTALSTHLVIEQVVEIQCMLAKSTDDYGFAVTDESLIRVAKTPYTFLLQAELRAINSGLEYREIEETDGNRYTGYVNKDGQAEGVGIRIWKDDGTKQIGKWLNNKLHQCGKIHFPSGNSYWGEFKKDKKEGYGTGEYASGNRYIGQWL